MEAKFGTDTQFIRKNRESDDYLLPGSLIKGNLRESWDELKILSDEPNISNTFNELLGKACDLSKYDPQRGRLIISDLYLESKEYIRDEIRERIRIDSERGAVAKGAIQMMKSPFAPGKEYTFSGQAQLFSNDDNYLNEIAWIEKGLQWITHIGAYRTIGFGRIANVKIDILNDSMKGNTESKLELDKDRFIIALSPDRPFCFSKRQADQNLFESEDFIPGGAIKGAIATALGKVQNSQNGNELINNLEKIQFSHAFPSENENIRPIIHPLSLVNSMDKIYDVALCDKPVLINGKSPAFSCDWKVPANSDDNDIFKHPTPNRELRVRTAIDSKNRRAKDENLFSYEMVVPDGFNWVGIVDFSRIEEKSRKSVAESLKNHLAMGISYLGKTKANANVKIINNLIDCNQSDFKSIREANNSFWVITLQSSALLNDPLFIPEKGKSNSLFEAYDAAFQDISGESLKLVRFFADQSLVGGYLSKRFPRNKIKYFPFLLTSPGSVFVLTPTLPEIKPEDVEKMVKEWYLNGLPLPQWVKDNYGTTWQKCPFMPENGYGEIAVNLSCHIKNKPENERMEEINVLI